ncbi:hypothetical protein BRYFOR_07519 [Marvinbryantia formatexigens DSM 14469]|uniref:DUF7768 domain-containing protein n=1 Tax=Marvinbryantia formatexigens DSM 14469 TaxID=478749 RepID=C6LFV9_9FIRM|nr:hypothetical protein [Marvinbryantia formatexigens]EET60323.1 hypothetical protein BRYFOR_07519 [Marvinbryantia formatexigens DSM 14469]UWO25337.1 hypothetical protein NQ534_02240 [Marvinbryantia formatexigens DSM 14469]
MEKVYIISRYAAATKKERCFNEQVARYFCRQIMREGNRPVAPHLFYPQFSDDSNPEERKAGLELALRDLDECDSFLLVIIDGIISEGMRGEIERVSRTENRRGYLVAMSRKEAEKLIEGSETDDAARSKHRSACRLSNGIFKLHKKA